MPVWMFVIIGLLALPGSSFASTSFSPGEDLPFNLKKARIPQENLITGGQISKNDLTKAAASGVEHIINLRTAKESPPPQDEQIWAQKAGVRYTSLPISGKRDITWQNAQKLFQLINAPKQPTIVHCRSGNRVGALFAVYGYFFQGLSRTKALAFGERAGLGSLKPAVDAYLQQPENQQLKASLQEAQAHIKTYQSKLKSALTQAIQQDGPAAAVQVCQQKAPQFAKQLDLVDTIGRTSLKYRNPANQPTAWMRPILEDYAAGRRHGPQLVKTDSKAMAYTAPIHVQGLCLTCHGSSIPKSVQSQLDKYYPNDRATGYQAGEFRGMFWVRLQPPADQ